MSAKHRSLTGVANCASAALLAISGAISCGKILGLDDYRVAPRPGRTQACGGFEYADESCGQCMARGCCSEDEACAADPGCSGQHKCESLCAPGDTACLGKCRFGRANNAKPYQDTIACQAVNCPEACSVPCGRPVAGPCDECTKALCCDDVRAVWKDAAVSSLLSCRVPCAGFEDQCPCTGSDAAFEAVRKLEACRNGLCSDSCTFALAEPDWNCLPTITWPPHALSMTELDMNFGVFAFGSGNIRKPLPNIRVRACDFGSDPPCTPPRASNLTNDLGWAALRMSPGVTRAAPFFDYFELHDESGATPPIIDTLFHTNAYVDPINLLWLGVPQTLLSGVQPRSNDGGPMWDEEHTGIVYVSAVSCGNGGGGISIDVKDHPGLFVYYTTPSLVLRAPDAESTVKGGLAVIVGVPPGVSTVEAWVKDTGEPVFRRQVLVRAGTLTVIGTMFPAPR